MSWLLVWQIVILMGMLTLCVCAIIDQLKGK